MKDSRYHFRDPASQSGIYRHGDSNPGTDPATRHCVYIFRDADRHVLYVGLTCRFGERISSHKHEKAWWLDVETVDVEHFDTREDARERELALIRELDPPHNIEGRNKVDRWACDECGGDDIVLLTWGAEEAYVTGFAAGRPELGEPDFVPNRGPRFLYCYDCHDYCDVEIRRTDGTTETVRGARGLDDSAVVALASPFQRSDAGGGR